MNTEENNNSLSERALSDPSTQRVDYFRNRTFRIVPQLMELESCSDGSSNI